MLSQNHNYETFYEVLKILNPKENNLNLILTLAGRIDKKIIKIFSNKIPTSLSPFSASIKPSEDIEISFFFNSLAIDEMGFKFFKKLWITILKII